MLSISNIAINTFLILVVVPQTHEEFRQIMNGYKLKSQRKFRGSLFMEPNFLEAPRAIDWREKGYVTPVKDQVMTGQAWSMTGGCFGVCFDHRSALRKN